MSDRLPSHAARLAELREKLPEVGDLFEDGNIVRWRVTEVLHTWVQENPDRIVATVTMECEG